MADFESGDKVRFINDRMKGTIISRKDKNYFLVLLEDGFEIPVAVNELVLVQKANQKNVETKTNNIVPGSSPLTQQIAQGYYVAITITEDKIREIHFHLINNTGSDILFTLFNPGLEFKGVTKGEINRGHTIKISSIPDSNLDMWRSMEISILEFDKRLKTIPAPLHFKLKFKETSLLKPKTHIPWLSAQGILLPLETASVKDSPSQKDQPVISPITMEPAEDIIDLHVEKLIDNTSQIPAEGILMMQVNHFGNHLEKAIAAQKDHIIFIHGIGNGILKKKIIEYAGNNPHVLKTEEADSKKFGYGATKIILKSR